MNSIHPPYFIFPEWGRWKSWFLVSFSLWSPTSHPPFSSPPLRVCLPWMGLQARVQPRVPADPALAFHPGAAEERRVPRCHCVAGGLRRICHQGPRWGGPSVGCQKVQTPDELRQAQPRSKVSPKHPGHSHVLMAHSFVSMNHMLRGLSQIILAIHAGRSCQWGLSIIYSHD